MSASAKANYFDSQNYLTWQLEAGTLHDRTAARTMAFPEGFTSGLLAAMSETGSQVLAETLYLCGEFHGRYRWQQLNHALSDFFQQPLTELPTTEVHHLLTEAWAVAGLGRASFNHDYLKHGVLHVTVSGAVLPAAFKATARETAGRPVDFLTAGMLAGMFSQAAQAEMVAYQLACESAGHPYSEFIVGLNNRLTGVPSFINQGMSASQIIQELQHV